MATDVLSLGGITFTDFSPPEEMMGGGQQAMMIHKLPGGARVIDTLGPDDANVTWNGFFYGNDAYTTVLALDGLRVAGQVLPLIWGGQYRSVIIDTFIFRVRRHPNWIRYAISCTVYQNPMQGNLSANFGDLDSLVQSDLGAAETASVSPADALAAGTSPL
jgi:hypothetical protein